MPTSVDSGWCSIAASSPWPWQRTLARCGSERWPRPMLKSKQRCLVSGQGISCGSPKQVTLCPMGRVMVDGYLSPSMIPLPMLSWRRVEKHQNILRTSPSSTRLNSLWKIVFECKLNMVIHLQNACQPHLKKNSAEVESRPPKFKSHWYSMSTSSEKVSAEVESRPPKFKIPVSFLKVIYPLSPS